jgi:hypothetical protein
MASNSWGVNFINILRLHFSPIFWRQKIAKLKVIRENLLNLLSYKKRKCEMLMKWTRGLVGWSLKGKRLREQQFDDQPSKGFNLYIIWPPFLHKFDFFKNRKCLKEPKINLNYIIEIICNHFWTRSSAGCVFENPDVEDKKVLIKNLIIFWVVSFVHFFFLFLGSIQIIRDFFWNFPDPPSPAPPHRCDILLFKTRMPGNVRWTSCSQTRLFNYKAFKIVL